LPQQPSRRITTATPRVRPRSRQALTATLSRNRPMPPGVRPRRGSPSASTPVRSQRYHAHRSMPAGHASCVRPGVIQLTRSRLP
jgi:hypothetical protein